MVKLRRKEQIFMKKSKYSAEQVAFALRQAESGTSVPEICRKMGISEQTFLVYEIFASIPEHSGLTEAHRPYRACAGSGKPGTLIEIIPTGRKV